MRTGLRSDGSRTKVWTTVALSRQGPISVIESLLLFLLPFFLAQLIEPSALSRLSAQAPEGPTASLDTRGHSGRDCRAVLVSLSLRLSTALPEETL